MKLCAHCGESFTGRSPTRIYCGKRCRDRARRARDKAAGKRTYKLKGRPATNVKARKFAPGDRFGSLVLVAYDGRTKHGDTMALFDCDCRARKRVRLGNVTSGATTDCADRENHPDPRRVEIPAYHAVHQRIGHERGSASRHPCKRCGEPAEQWAYLGGDPDAQSDADGKDAGLTYSLDLNQYVPLCRCCHGKYDRAIHVEQNGDRTATSLVGRALFLATIS